MIGFLTMHASYPVPSLNLPRMGPPVIGTASSPPQPMTISQMAAAQAHTFMAQRAPAGVSGCAACAGSEAVALSDVAPASLWSRIPLWAKIAGGVAIAGGVGFLVYKATR